VHAAELWAQSRGSRHGFPGETFPSFNSHTVFKNFKFLPVYYL